MSPAMDRSSLPIRLAVSAIAEREINMGCFQKLSVSNQQNCMLSPAVAVFSRSQATTTIRIERIVSKATLDFKIKDMQDLIGRLE